MATQNMRSLVIYGKSQDELVAAVENLPRGKSVPPGEGLPIKLEYGDVSIHIGVMSDGTLITSTVSPQDSTPDVVVPLSEDKLQLLATDLDEIGIPYSWDYSDNDKKKLG
ncbi:MULTISPECIES: hypothetical protein [unclassified Duganella]|uniref:hypothetical protein n=1 Tax=unclassified Duganella TaxID=2636909 RepID=UPI000B7DBC77|nr:MULTISPECIES: hypothetical protein [unclassified Duganella]